MARPRAFDPDTALQDVMNVFWKKGYEGASLQDIEAATGLNKQSLYRAFGDKRAMYLAALDIYEKNIIAERILWSIPATVPMTGSIPCSRTPSPREP